MKTKKISHFISILALLAFTMINTSAIVTGPGDPLKENILTQKTWRVDMVYCVLNGSFTKYVHGGTNTTGVAYNNTRFRFRKGGSGTYTNEYGAKYSLTWKFTSTDKRTMNVIVNTPTVNNSTWEIVEIAGEYMNFSVNFSVNGNADNMETFRLKQIH